MWHTLSILAQLLSLMGVCLKGDLPNKALSMVREWMSLHREELQRMWDTQEFVEIPGLD